MVTPFQPCKAELATHRLAVGKPTCPENMTSCIAPDAPQDAMLRALSCAPNVLITIFNSDDMPKSPAALL
jgi:hypothetical protein